MHDSAKRAPLCAWKAGGWVKIVLANSRASHASKLVLVTLAAQADDEGLCSIAVPALAKLCDVTDRQIQRTLAALVVDRELCEVAKGGGRGRPAVYQITVTPVSPFPARFRKPKG